MDINTLKQKKLTDLRTIAKAMKIKNISRLKKDELINVIINGNSEDDIIDSENNTDVSSPKKEVVRNNI